MVELPGRQFRRDQDSQPGAKLPGDPGRLQLQQVLHGADLDIKFNFSINHNIKQKEAIIIP